MVNAVTSSTADNWVRPHEMHIVHVCEGLHGECTGASEGCLDADGITRFIGILQNKLATWSDSEGQFWGRYDAAIKELIEATLEECRQRIPAELFPENR